MIKNKIEKDILYESIFRNKVFIFFIFILVLISKYISRTVLNMTHVILFIKYYMPFLICILFIFYRYTKYKNYYKHKIKDAADITIVSLYIVFYNVLAWLIVNILLGFIIIIGAAKSSTEIFNCEISTVFTINADRIEYIFKNKKYILQLDNGTPDVNEIPNDYYLRVGLKKSILDTYMLDSYTLIKKENELKSN